MSRFESILSLSVGRFDPQTGLAKLNESQISFLFTNLHFSITRVNIVSCYFLVIEFGIPLSYIFTDKNDLRDVLLVIIWEMSYLYND